MTLGELGPEGGLVSPRKGWEARLCLELEKGRGPAGHKMGPAQSKQGAEQEAVGTGR